jgi:23S rRNA (uracil1939-C5)-methyltransferase
VTCPYVEACGGCSLLPIPYRQQLEGKAATLRRLLGSVPNASRVVSRNDLFLHVPFPGLFPARFRHKVSFAFGTDPVGGRLMMGHYRKASNRLLPVDECCVHSDRGNRIAFALRDHMIRSGIGAAGSSTDAVLRHVIVRTTADDREAVALLVVSRNDKALRKPIRVFLTSVDAPDGFFVNINADQGPFMIGDRTIRIHGRSHVREVVGGFSYLISPTAFFQTNPQAAAILQAYVVQSVSGARRVLDLYCGSGLFALPLAASGSTVTGVEENGQAVEDGRRNARLNAIPSGRLRLRASRVEAAVDALSREQWDAVILDPPRQGCSDHMLEAVFQRMRPERVTYVSCNPEVLGAELPGIVECGYVVEDVRAVDMFPHTEHIEVVVRFSKS